MDRFLMDHCLNYKTAACDLRMKEARHAGPMEIGGPIPTFPIFKDQDKLDQICEACSAARFKIDQLECPVCHERTKIVRGKPEKMSLRNEAGRVTAYHFFCKSCIRRLFSETDLLG